MNRIYIYMCIRAYSLSCVQLFATPWIVARQPPLFMGILQARILEWVAMPSSHMYMHTLICCSVTQSCPTLWDPQAAGQASLSLAVSQSLPKLMSIEPATPSSCLILCCFLRLLPSIFPSIRVFFNELALRIRWPKYVCIYIHFLKSFLPYRPLQSIE